MKNNIVFCKSNRKFSFTSFVNCSFLWSIKTIICPTLQLKFCYGLFEFSVAYGVFVSVHIHQRPTVEVTGHKAHGPVPQPGAVVIARVRFLKRKLLNSKWVRTWALKHGLYLTGLHHNDLLVRNSYTIGL